MVNEQNSKFAPAGYGLGEIGGKRLTSEDDINTIFENGFYSWYDSAPVNAPGPYMIMVVYSSYFGNIVQEFYHLSLGKYTKVCRYYDSGAWGELEYINPPMALGVEYRTTERCFGLPVYTKIFDFGILSESKTITLDERYSYILRTQAFSYYRTEAKELSDWSMRSKSDTANMLLSLHCGSALVEHAQNVGEIGYVQMWYVKG